MIPTRADARGFALIAALWLIILVAGVSASVFMPLRTARSQALNVLARAAARQEARAGVTHAVALLRGQLAAEVDLATDSETTLDRLADLQQAAANLGRVPGPGGGTYTMTLTDESARLPINLASEAEIQRFLRGLGIPPLRSSHVAASIADWMDADDLHRLNGAEWDDYYSDIPGAPQPANAPLTTLEELRSVRGVDRELFDRIRPHLTVAAEARVNLNSAHRAVIAGLPGLDEEAARRIEVRRRASPQPISLEEVAVLLAPESRERMQARYGDLSRSVTFRSGLIGLASVGYPAGQGRPVRLEAALAVASGRVSVVRVVEVR